jgi:very-short-patch-repair endonuclease
VSINDALAVGLPLPSREGKKGRVVGKFSDFALRSPLSKASLAKGECMKSKMSSKLTKYAKTMRKNPTLAEKKLWNRLRSKQMKGIKFRRQQPIDDMIVDFVNFEKKVIIEVDGGQHAIEKEKDTERDRQLTGKGFKVLRFWNNDVIKNTDEVLERIRQECLDRD